MNPNPSQLDPGQIAKREFDSDNDAKRVNVVAGSAEFSIDSEKVDGSEFTVGTDEVLTLGAIVDDVTPASIDEGDVGAIRMSANRNVYTQIRDAAGNERGANVTASNALVVDATGTTSLPLPTGASTEATLSSLDGKVTAVDTGNVTVASSVLPTGAATETTLDAIKTSVELLDNTVSGNELQVDIVNTPTVQATDFDIRDLTSASDSVEVLQSTHDDLNVNANLQVGNADVENANPVPISDAGGSITVDGSVTTTDSGFTNAAFTRLAYSSTNVTTGAYVELLASTAAEYKEIHVIDTSGQTLKIAFGAAASEVDKIIVPPGGAYPIKLTIPASTRISIRAISSTASTGDVCIQLLG
jgi:hypothetical protein